MCTVTISFGIFFYLEAPKPEQNQKHLCSISKDREWITGDPTSEPIVLCTVFIV